MNRVLIFEPNGTLLSELRQALEKSHLWVAEGSNAETTREILRRQFFHVCVWPLESPEEIPALFELKKEKPNLAIVVLTSRRDASFVVNCMRAGASNVAIREDGLHSFVQTIQETLARIVPDDVLEEASEFPLKHFVGRNPKVLEIFQLIMSIRNTDSTVLITGESGTGKEVVARAIHDLSTRARQPWVAVNCGAIPANLLESELFGHVKGAFTGATQTRAGRFQVAGSGTIFLDEISDLPFDLQAKTLRVIQNRVYESVGSPYSQTMEARIIAATNQDLLSAVAERRFRQDLYYRLNVIPIFIPPLRQRKSDIPLLARSFLEKFCRLNNRHFVGISEEAMQTLMDYHWPGNIRELENLMERVVVLKKGEGIIERKDFPVHHFTNVQLDRFVANVALPDDGLDFNDAVNEFENELILQALQKTSGNKNRAASLLNLNRTTLVEKLKRKGLRILS